MAIIIATGFEDLADGTLPGGSPPWSSSPYQDSLINAGWLPGRLGNTWPATRVVSADAHSGSKACRMGSEAEDGQSDNGGISDLQRRFISAGTNPNLTVEGWFKRLDFVNPNTGTLAKHGPQIKVYGADFDIARYLGIFNPHLTNTLVLSALGVTLATVTGVFVDDVYQKLRAEFLFSSVDLTVSPIDVHADGVARVYVNDVLLVNLTAIRLGCSTEGWASDLNGYRHIQLEINGWLDDLVIHDTPATTLPDQPDLPNTPPCCHSDCCGGDTPGGQPPGHPGPRLPPVAPDWTPDCTGGGSVPTAADVTDAESWVM